MESFRRNRKRGAVAAGLLAAASMTVISPAALGAERTHPAGFKANKSKVASAKTVKVKGRFMASEPSRTENASDERQTTSGERRVRPLRRKRVVIEFRPANQRSWHVVKRSRTGKGGGFREPIKARVSGFYRARVPGGATTRKVKVRVRSRLKTKLKGRHIQDSGKVRVRGRVLPANRGRRVVVKIGSEKLKTRTSSKGTFAVKQQLGDVGRRKVRVKAHGDRLAAGRGRNLGRIAVYRSGHASWYGGGGTTACGQSLHGGMVGVAHKTLPCGTKVTFRYEGNTVTAPVIDRGPFIAGREWDLTEALKRKLGFGDVGVVWASY